MYVTSTIQTQYTQSTNKKNYNDDTTNPFKGQDYVLKMLDEEGNELLNNILADKTDDEKWMLKLSLDMSLSTEVKNATLVNSRDSSVDRLEAFIEERKRQNASDMQGTGAMAEKLLEAYKNSSSFVGVENREDSVVDDFLEELYSKESISLRSTIIKDEIEKKVDVYASLMLQERADDSMSELERAKMLSQFKNELLQEYRDSLESSNDDSLGVEQQAMIKVLLEENVKETSSLEALLAATFTSKDKNIKEARTPEKIIAEYRAMPGQGGVLDIEAYKREKALKFAEHEQYFKVEYEHYEKYKDVFTPIYSNYTTEKANNISRELNAQFPEFSAMREKAYRGGTEEDKEAFEDMFWDYQAYNKYLREKYDMDMSTGGFMAATKESSKAYNYAVYEALESGLSISEATEKARSILSTFGGGEAQAFSWMFFSGLPEDIEAATEIPEEEIDYNKQIDLRDYGFEHNFWSDAYLNSFEGDSLGVKSRIMYDIKLYSFLLENNELIDTRLDELKERAYQTDRGKEWYDWRNEDGKFNEEFKSSFQEKYDNALYAKEIHDKYADKIFDNSLLDKMDK